MRNILLLIASLFCHICYGQSFTNNYTFNTQDGLSNNTVTALQKDSAGFLWIGTHEGLNRYDGTHFLNVLSNQKNNLPSNNISKIGFISKTQLFVGTDAGLCLLNTTTLTGKQIPLPYHSSFANTGFYISDILYNKNAAEVWVCTWHGIFVMDTTGEVKKKMLGDVSDMHKGYFARYLLSDAKGGVYFFSQQKNRFYSPDFTKQDLMPVENKITELPLNRLLQDNYRLMSAGMTGNKMTCIFSKAVSGSTDERIAYNNNAGQYFTDQLVIKTSVQKRISNAVPLNDSVFLLNSFFGEPLLYNANNHTIRMVADHPLWFTSWPDGLGASVLVDNKNTWVGTSKNLLQFPVQTDFFKTNPLLISKVKGSKSLVSYNYGIYSNNKLWVACMGAGLFALDTLQNTVASFERQLLQPAYQKKLISTQVLDVGKSLWLFSVYGPVQLNIAAQRLMLPDGIDKDPAFDESAGYPLQDSKGNLWTTLPDGIAKYDPRTNTFTNYKTKYKGGVFPLLRAGPKSEDNNGNIWMARADTLVKLNTVSDQFSTVLLTSQGRAVRSVLNMTSDGNDTLYLNVSGSFGIYTISTGHLSLFSKQTGIISTVINEIVCDKNGNAWIATEGGLVCFNKQKNKFSSYTKADGLPDDNIISINFTDSGKQTLFLGFAKTYCLFQPGHFLQKKEVPENIITGMEADGQSLTTNGPLVLTYKQNNIFFTYTGINYNQGQQNNYACMLENFDQDWKYTGAERKINYINLPPGKYVFKVKSANHQGEWNDAPATMAFEIMPPFWQRWWFRILVICAVIVIAFYFVKKREMDIQLENYIKLQMSELRMQALRAQMNPHFIFNSLNSIQHYILSNNSIDAASYLSKFAKLMRRILDQSKHNFLPLADVMETLQLYVSIEAFRFNHEFNYTFDIEQNETLLDASVPPMLFQPFVENAILHGLMPKKGEKLLAITCKLVNNQAEIIIDDNGRGRIKSNADADHLSQGEKLTAGMLESWQQIKNSKASIEITDKTNDGQPAGTTVKIILPLN